MNGSTEQINYEELIFENVAPALGFSEFRKLIHETYVNLLPSDIEKKKQYGDQLYGMLQKSYADQGGLVGGGFKDVHDMVHNIPFWKIHKIGGEIKSAAFYKDTDGRKRVAITTDGSDAGKVSASKIVGDDLKRHRAYMEVSGKSLSVLKKIVPIADHVHSFDSAAEFHRKYGQNIIRPESDDPEVVRHPEFKDNFYQREIGGTMKTKLMLGKRDNKITEATAEDHFKASKSRFNRSHYVTGGWTVIPNTHPAAQAVDRRPEFSTDDWNTLHDKSVAAIHKFGVPSGYHVMFSRKMDQGYITHVDHAAKKLNIVTVLPRGRYRPTKEGDGRVIFESISNDFIDVD